MPRPRGGDWLDEEMLALRRAGVDVLVCLLTRVERDELDLGDESAAAVRAGLDFHELPITDFGVPDPARLRALLDALAARLDGGRHVVVHCRGGIGRSSLVAAGLLVMLGTPPARVWNVITAARGRPVPETDEQRRWMDRFWAEESHDSG